MSVGRNIKDTVRNLTRNHFWPRYVALSGLRLWMAATTRYTLATDSGNAHASHDVAWSMGYLIRVFEAYKTAANVERFYGKVAEIGPGDSCGIGLLFLADGCTHVDLVDRFYSVRDSAQQVNINRALVDKFPQLRALLINESFSESSFRELARSYGPSAAAEKFFADHTGYDFIVSAAVLEHVYDPLRALAAAAAALNPGGFLLHQVDLRDHGQFSTYFHELKFLEIPPALYGPLSWCGGPNRVRLTAYTDLLRRLNFCYKIRVTHLAGIPEGTFEHGTLDELPRDLLDRSRLYVSSVRPNLVKPYRQMSDEDLMLTSFMIAAQKS